MRNLVLLVGTFVLCFASVVLSQEPHVGAPVRVSNGCINLIVDKEVQKSLKLDESQVAAIEEKYVVVSEAYREFVKHISGKKVDTEAISELAFKSSNIQEDFEIELLEILDPVQLRCLAGVCLRKEGVLAVKYQVVAEELKLSRTQTTKIFRIFRMSRPAAATSAKEAMEQVAAQNKKKREDILHVLTSEQVKEMNDLSGSK